MHEDRRAQPRPHVGGAAGEEAELVVVGERQLAPQLLVEPIHQTPRLLDAEPRHEALHAQVVLLVDHHAHGIDVGEVDGRPARRTALLLAQQVPRHEPALQEDAPRADRHVGELEQIPAPEGLGAPHRLLEPPKHGLAVVDPGPGAEGVALEVPREPDPGRQHDVGVVAAGLEPAQPVVGDRAEVAHAGSSDRISSLSSAARSKSSDSTALCSLRRRPSRRRSMSEAEGSGGR